MKKISVLLLSISVLFGGMTAGVSIYVSESEATGNTINGQMAADMLDDGWRAGLGRVMGSDYLLFQTYGIIGTTTPVGSGYTHMNFGTSNEVLVSLRNMTGGGFGQLQTNTATQPEWNSSSSLASNSPKPLSLSGTNYWNESSIGSTSSRNALLFEFKDLVNGFGLWLGDVETRSDGLGVLAQIQLFDSSGAILMSGGIAPFAGTNQQLCGGSYVGCGNGTTRFVGFMDSLKQVKYMLIVVGDDDASGNGNSEHLSFIGATIATLSGGANSGAIATGDLNTGNTTSGSVVSGTINTGVVNTGGNTENGSMNGTGSNLSGNVNMTGSMTGSIGTTGATQTGQNNGGVITGDLLTGNSNNGTSSAGIYQTGFTTGSTEDSTGEIDSGDPGTVIETGALDQTGAQSGNDAGGATGMQDAQAGVSQTGNVGTGITETGIINYNIGNNEPVNTGIAVFDVVLNQSNGSQIIINYYISNGKPYERIPLPDANKFEKYVQKKRIIGKNKYALR